MRQVTFGFKTVVRTGKWEKNISFSIQQWNVLHRKLLCLFKTMYTNFCLLICSYKISHHRKRAFITRSEIYITLNALVNTWLRTKIVVIYPWNVLQVAYCFRFISLLRLHTLWKKKTHLPNTHCHKICYSKLFFYLQAAKNLPLWLEDRSPTEVYFVWRSS